MYVYLLTLDVQSVHGYYRTRKETGELSCTIEIHIPVRDRTFVYISCSSLLHESGIYIFVFRKFLKQKHGVALNDSGKDIIIIVDIG